MSVKLKKAPSRLGEQDLLCKSGCGFFGNPSWQGYCSKCWRDSHLAKSKAFTPEKASTPGSIKTFTEFEEKKKKHVDKRKETVKSIFRKYNPPESGSKQPNIDFIRGSSPPSSASTSAAPHSRPSSRRNSETSRQSAELLIDFLHGFSKEMANDVSRLVRNIVDQIYKMAQQCTNIEVISDFIINHYQSFEDRIKTHNLYRGIDDEKLDEMIRLAEHYVCTRIYRSVFAHNCTQDEEIDLEIQGKIRKYHWISSSHLDINIDESKEKVRNLLDDAITEIIEMDTVRVPRMKLDCITRCSKSIFKLLNESKQGPISADDFLPALIYVVLRANPPQFKSNVMFVTRFANPSCLLAGEGAYNFTNLCCAVSFIENLTAESLNLTISEFDDYMSGKLISYDATCRINREHISNCEQNAKLFDSLETRCKLLQEEKQKLEEQIIARKARILEEVRVCIESAPCTLRAVKVPEGIDDNVSEETSNLLPTPLLPSVAKEE